MSFLCLVTAIIFERIHLVDWHTKTKIRYSFLCENVSAKKMLNFYQLINKMEIRGSLS